MREQPDDEAENLGGAERELEASLARLTPQGSGVDPLAIAFEAGRRSAGNVLHVWRAAAAVLVVGLAVSLFVRTSSESVTPAANSSRPVQVATISSPAPRAELDPAQSRPAYMTLRQNVLDRGAESLPILRLADTPDRTPNAGDASLITGNPL